MPAQACPQDYGSLADLMRGDRGAPNEIFPLPEPPSVGPSSVPVGLHLLGLPLCSQAGPPQVFRPDGGEAGVGAHPDLCTHPRDELQGLARPAFSLCPHHPTQVGLKEMPVCAWKMNEVCVEWKKRALLQGELQLVLEQRSSSTPLPQHILAPSHFCFRMNNWSSCCESGQPGPFWATASSLAFYPGTLSLLSY